jgi:chorismate mutase
MKIKYRFFICMLVYALSGEACSCEQKLASEIFSLINERLSYMDVVARHKAKFGLPIEDVEREKVVLNSAISSAQLLGIAPESIHRFYELQILVAKAIQYRARAALLHDHHIEAQDLNTDIRPKLLTLGRKFDNKLATYLSSCTFSSNDKEEFLDKLTSPYLSTRDKTALFKALITISLSSQVD